jgi:ABC-type multidrug transport system fused ATPase/permease subunit
MSPGALVSFMLYQQSLSSSFTMMGDVVSALAAAVGAADKVVELMERRAEVSQAGGFIPAEFRGGRRAAAPRRCLMVPQGEALGPALARHCGQGLPR